MSSLRVRKLITRNKEIYIHCRRYVIVKWVNICLYFLPKSPAALLDEIFYENFYRHHHLNVPRRTKIWQILVRQFRSLIFSKYFRDYFKFSSLMMFRASFIMQLISEWIRTASTYYVRLLKIQWNKICYVSIVNLHFRDLCSMYVKKNTK